MSDSARKRRIVAWLRGRDGDACFYCGKPMRFPYDLEPIQARKATVEHLIDRSLGGTMHHGNAVLAHDKCNSARSPLKTVAEKIASRDANAPPIPMAVRATVANEQRAQAEMLAYRRERGVELRGVA